MTSRTTFLAYVQANHPRDVYDCVVAMLEKFPDADPFTVLHKVTTSTEEHLTDVKVAKRLAGMPCTTTFRRKPRKANSTKTEV